MKAQNARTMSLIDNCLFAADRLKASTLKSFVPPRSTVDASVSHWFARGWRRSARDLSDFIDPGVYEIEH